MKSLEHLKKDIAQRLMPQLEPLEERVSEPKRSTCPSPSEPHLSARDHKVERGSESYSESYEFREAECALETLEA